MPIWISEARLPTFSDFGFGAVGNPVWGGGHLGCVEWYLSMMDGGAFSVKAVREK